MSKNKQQNSKTSREANKIPSKNSNHVITKKLDVINNQSNVLKKMIQSFKGNKDDQPEKDHTKGKK